MPLTFAEVAGCAQLMQELYARGRRRQVRLQLSEYIDRDGEAIYIYDARVALRDVSGELQVRAPLVVLMHPDTATKVRKMLTYGPNTAVSNELIAVVIIEAQLAVRPELRGVWGW